MTLGEGHKDPFLDICVHGKKGARFINGELKNPNCTNCFPTHPQEQEDDDYHDSTYVSYLSSSGPHTPAWYRKWIY